MRNVLSRSSTIAVTLVLAVTLVGCGGSSKSAGSGEPETDTGGDLSTVACPLSALPKSGPKIKISLWYGNQQGKNKEVMEQLAKSYNASQNRVEITASDQGQDYNAMLDKYTAAIQGDRIPNVMFADSSHTQFLVDSGTIIPGGACAKEGVAPLDHMIPVVKSYYTVDGAYIPASVNLTSTLNYYNRISFEKAGLPNKAPGTLAELRAVAEKLDAAKIKDMKWPVSMVVAPGFFDAWMTGAGEDVLNNDNGRKGHATRATFNTPTAVKLLNELKGMYDDGLIAKVSNTPGQLDQYLNVAQGKSAMVIESSAAATTIEAFLGGGLSAEDLKQGGLSGLSKGATVAPGFGEFPGLNKAGQVPVIGGAYFVTNGGSKAQQAAAMDFARYLNEIPQQATWLIDGSYLSANTLVSEDPNVKDFYENSPSGMALQVAMNQVANVPASQPGPLVGPFDQYNKAVQSMMESVLFNDADPAKALAKAEAAVNEALESYNTENGF